MKVMKFGGSSLRSGPDLERIAQLILDQPEDPVIVVSALQGVTDTILEGLPTIQGSEEDVGALLQTLKDRHMDTITECDPNLAEPAQELLTPAFEKLERLLYGIAYTEELTPKTRDLAVSFGERLSARLMSLALEAQGATARHVDGDELGIMTDGNFGHATAVMAPTIENVQKHLLPMIEAGTIPVVTGFFGRDEAGHATTFGRGGSDYSAAVLARALEADRLEVWKDVDGFLTADPNRVEKAQPIPYMTYDEAAELAYLGAQVLHPRTVEPLHDHGIPILVKNTMNPQAPGTTIGPPRDEPAHLRAIGAREGFAIVRLIGSGMAYTPGVGREVFRVLGDAEINVVNMAASQASFALLVAQDDAEAAAELIREAGIPTVEDVDVSPHLSLVCFVGENIGAHEGVAGRVFSVIGDRGVNVEMISVGASDVALAFVVGEGEVEDALLALHDAFLREGATPAQTLSKTAKEETMP